MNKLLFDEYGLDYPTIWAEGLDIAWTVAEKNGEVMETRGPIRDILSFPALLGATLALMDSNAQRLAFIRQAVERIVEEGKCPAKVIATMDHGEALQGAAISLTKIREMVNEMFAQRRSVAAAVPQMMQEVVLGIDGGGTKTVYALCTMKGEVLFTLRGPSVSVIQYGEEGLRLALTEGLRGVQQGAGLQRESLRAVCLGAPCWGESEVGDAIIRAVATEVFGDAPCYICNDAEIACAGSFALRPGINIVAGTGAIAFGMDSHGHTARCGGWGHYFGDEGSGYWLGMRLLSLFCKQADGRLPRQVIYGLVRERLGLKVDFEAIDLVGKTILPYREKVADLQMLLCEAAMQGDTDAIESYREAAREIALNVEGVLGALDFPEGAMVSYSGGIFKAGALIMESFCEALHARRCSVVQPLAQPWVGALMLSLRLAGRDTREALQRVMEAGHRDV